MDIESLKGPLIGGAMIGAAAGLWLLLSGKTAGVSGAVYGAMTGEKNEAPWQAAFLAGLLVGGVLLSLLLPATLPASLGSNHVLLAAGGLLVGFGTRLGGGCTSGHGVCGVGRLSLRSVAATCTFMAAGALTVFLARHVVGA